MMKAAGKAEVMLSSPPAEKPRPYQEMWQIDEGEVELGPGET